MTDFRPNAECIAICFQCEAPYSLGKHETLEQALEAAKAPFPACGADGGRRDFLGPGTSLEPALEEIQRRKSVAAAQARVAESKRGKELLQ